MLLKVTDGADGWVLIDNVDQVHLTSSKHNISQVDELNALKDENSLSLVSKEHFIKNGSVEVGAIEFERQGKRQKAFFTGTVFVCNDKGDTVDRLSVNRRVEKRKN